MRSILALLFGGTLIVNAQNPSPAQQAEQFYRQGLEAEKTGDVTAARTAYQQALRINPRHANSQYRLGELKNEGAGVAAKGRQAKFGQTIIPQFAIEDVSLSEGLEALRVAMEKADPANPPNFVLQDPDNKLAKARISFVLKGVPAKAILEYLLSQSGAVATYDEYAVIIRPPGLPGKN
jgi:tetratricopeptide (TPR) repeat protein